MEPVIAESARRHGCADEDILHAYRQAIRVWPHADDDMDMIVGPVRSAMGMLELGVVTAWDGTSVIVHAMKADPSISEVIAMPRSVREILEQADELARRFEDLEPDPGDKAGAEALAVLHRAVLGKAAAENAIVEAVNHARDHGQSWDAIGRRLGTSGEAARQRYGQRSHR